MTSFNIDQWLSGEEGTRVVDAIKRAWDEQPDVNELDVVLDPEIMLTNAATTALRAALSLTTTETCPVCAEDRARALAKADLLPNDPNAATAQAVSEVLVATFDALGCPNPDCEGGTVPGEPILSVREESRDH